MYDKSAQIEGLRALADLLETNPELHDDLKYHLGNMGTYVFEDAKDRLVNWIRSNKNSPFIINKDYNGDYFTLSLEIPSANKEDKGFVFKVMTNRSNVCTPKVVGKKSVTHRVPSEPIVYVEKVVEEDEIEWECHPLLKS